MSRCRCPTGALRHLSSASLAHSAPRRRARRPHPDGTPARTHAHSHTAQPPARKRAHRAARAHGCIYHAMPTQPTQADAERGLGRRTQCSSGCSSMRARECSRPPTATPACHECAMNAPVWVRQATRRSQHAPRAGGICEAVRARRPKRAETISRRGVRRSRSEG